MWLSPPEELETLEITERDAKSASLQLRVDLAAIPGGLQGWRSAIQIETEHGSKDPDTDVTADRLMPTAKIALAHLKEDLWYYERLGAAERRAQTEWDAYPGGMPSPIWEPPEDPKIWESIRVRETGRWAVQNWRRQRIVKGGFIFQDIFPHPTGSQEEDDMGYGSELDFVTSVRGLRRASDIDFLAKQSAESQFTVLERRLLELRWFDLMLTAKAALGRRSDQPLSAEEAADVFLSDEYLRGPAWHSWQMERGRLRPAPKIRGFRPQPLDSGVRPLEPRGCDLARRLGPTFLSDQEQVRNNRLSPLWMANTRAIAQDGISRDPSRRVRWTQLWRMIVSRLERELQMPWTRFNAGHSLRVLITFEQGPANTGAGLDPLGHFSDPDSIWYKLTHPEEGETTEEEVDSQPMEVDGRRLARAAVVIQLRVAVKNPEDPRGRPSPMAYLLNGKVRATLVMEWNRTYRFEFDATVSGGNHPLYLTRSSVGAGKDSILRPEKLQEIHKAVLETKTGAFEIKPSRDVTTTDGPLYYQCAVHPNMGWKLVVKKSE